MSSLVKFDALAPIGSLEAYIRQVNLMPMLTLSEEQQLATQLQQQQDLQAARKLVLAHLRFVVKIARGYLGYGLPLGDLIQEGNIGLMKAVKRFDPGLGVRLVSFAVHWVKAEIHEFVLRNWRIVKVATTKAQRKLFFNLNRKLKELDVHNQAGINAIAQSLAVTPEEVVTMQTRLYAQDVAFDAGTDDESGDSGAAFAPAHYLQDNRYNPAHLLEKQDWSDSREQNLQHALLTLDERSRNVLYQRWLAQDKATLHDLAAQYNVSAERIRQIEKVAMAKVKQVIQETE